MKSISLCPSPMGYLVLHLGIYTNNYVFSAHRLIIIINWKIINNCFENTFLIFNILCLKMCSLRGGDFRNQFSVFGLYVMPTHG